jgi:uncharacterized membrane protein (TIGR02234 family)
MTTISEPMVVAIPEARAKRLRLYTIAAIGVVAGLTLITTTQNWWTVHLSRQALPIAGTVAAPALTALTLCALVLAAALALAGPVFRVILGLLQLLISFTIVFSSIISLARPDQPSESAVQTATGIAGTDSIDALIKSVTFTPWGFIAIAFGVLAFLIGIWLLVTSRLWPAASRKYQAVRFEAADGPRDAVIDWDALSDGTDPTAESGPASDAKPVK